MPTTSTPSKDALVSLSEQLKKRLVSSGRNRKGSISPEFRQELIGALDCLAELAIEASFLEGVLSEELHAIQPLNGEFADPDFLQAQPGLSTAEPKCTDDQPTCSLVPPSVPPVSLDLDEVARTVTQAVERTLSSWQVQLTESIAKSVVAPFEAESTEAHLRSVENEEHQRLVVSDLESELSDTLLQLSAANDQLAQCHSELRNCRDQLAQAEYRIAEVELAPLHVSGNDDDLSEQLKQQLESALNELADVQQQNCELAAKLAQQTANVATSSSSARRGNAEQLSWEERKVLMLKQLEGDSSASGAAATSSLPHHENLEIQEIIGASQLEIARRDEEIAELREIVRMQSEARDGVAIGAAGFAQLLDSDELVQQERQKLRDIQQEWETKLRQAEIDLSMERAKIARERIALEKQKEELAQTQESNGPKEKNIERRWLRILGLSDKEQLK